MARFYPSFSCSIKDSKFAHPFLSKSSHFVGAHCCWFWAAKLAGWRMGAYSAELDAALVYRFAASPRYYPSDDDSFLDPVRDSPGPDSAYVTILSP